VLFNIVCYTVCCLYECKTWSRTTKKEHGLKVFKCRILRKIFGLRVTGDWRRLHNEELYDMYFTPNITWVIKSRIMRWVGCMGERRGT